MADLYEVETILDYRSLGEMYSEVGRTELDLNPMFSMYGNVNSRNYETDEVEFIKLSTIKDPAPLNYRNQPARVLQPTGKERRRVSAFGMFNVMPMGGEPLLMLRHPEQWALQQKGREEIDQQLNDFGRRHAITKQVIQSHTFFRQNIYVDKEGEILESSSGAELTIPTGIPTRNVGSIPGSTFGIGVSGNIIDALWSTASTDIISQLDLLRIAAQAQNTNPPKHIWINGKKKKMLRDNTKLLAYYSGIERLDKALNGDTFELEDYVFHFFSGTYTTASGSLGFYIPETQVCITPEPGPWLKTGNVKGLVCNTLDISRLTGTNDIMSAWDEVYGDFAYMVPQHNPPSVEMYMGSHWLIAFANPSEVFAPTVFA